MTDEFVPRKKERSTRMHRTVRMDAGLVVQLKRCVEYNDSNDSWVMSQCIKAALEDLNKGFHIRSDFMISGAETVQFRIEQEWLNWITNLAKEHDISFEKVVNQCVDYILNHKYKD